MKRSVGGEGGGEGAHRLIRMVAGVLLAEVQESLFKHASIDGRWPASSNVTGDGGALIWVAVAGDDRVNKHSLREWAKTFAGWDGLARRRRRCTSPHPPCHSTSSSLRMNNMPHHFVTFYECDFDIID